MKNLFFVLIASILLWSCNSGASKKSGNEAETKTEEAKIEVVTVDELLASPEKYVDNDIELKGLCIHTCKHSGKKLFLQGSDENQLIQVFADGDITGFGSELEGSELIVKGVLSVIEIVPETEAEVDAEHEHSHEEGHQCETESKAKNYKLNCVSYEIVEI